MPHTSPADLALFTDLYELKMAQAFVEEGFTGTAVFTLFVRRLPPGRNYLLACGVGTVLDDIERMRFTSEDLEYLESLRLFSPALLEWLRGFRFTGTIYAVPEGTPVFANEPIMEIVAPVAEGQVIETLLMNQVHVQTLLASKAARVVTAAAGRTVVDFGARRMHGIDAAVKAARAFYVAGVDGTSNLLAGKLFGIPPAGTMAHSYIQAHEDEGEAYRAFARAFPRTTLLVDTYDTLAGVRRVIDLYRQAPEDFTVAALRLDSGDLNSLARETRALLDDAGLRQVRIFASGGLDEHQVAKLLASGAPIDGFGVGTDMGVSADAPSLDLVYKLAEYAGEGRTKLSLGKPVLPGRKQVFRRESDGVAAEDVIARADERLDGRPLLEMVMQEGRRVPGAAGTLEAARERARAEVRKLPPRVRALEMADPPYIVRVSAALDEHHARVRSRTAGSSRSNEGRG